MKKNYINITLLLLAVGHTFLMAQDYTRFNNITVGDGLPHSDITSIVQDSTGFIWIGTLNGLCRYDGREIVVYNIYNSGNSINNERVHALYADQNSTLYIGTENGGLNIYNSELDSFSYFKHNPNNINSIPSNTINNINEGNKNRIWISTRNGVCLLQENSVNEISFKRFPFLQFNTRCVLETEDGVLLITGGNGFFKYDINEEKLEKILDGTFRSICNIGNNQYLIAGKQGLLKFDLQKRSYKKHLDESVRYIFSDSQKNIWIGLTKHGIIKFNEQLDLLSKYTKEQPNISNLIYDEVTCIFEDNSKCIWIATLNGISKLSHGYQNFELINTTRGPQKSLNTDKTLTFYQDPNKRNMIWIGTSGGGINILNRENGEIKILDAHFNKELANKHVSAFFEDHNGALWIGTWGNLYVLTKTEKEKIYNNKPFQIINMSKRANYESHSIFKIIQDNDGEIWMCTHSGLLNYKPSNYSYYSGRFENFVHDPSNSESISANFLTDILIEQEKGEGKIIWIGSQKGVDKLSITDGDTLISRILTTKLNKEIIPKNKHVSVIHKDSKNNLWVLFIGGELVKFTGNRYGNNNFQSQLFQLNVQQNLNVTESLQEDNEGNFWIGGIGLTRYNPNNGNYKFFSYDDGLQSHSFKIYSSYKLNTGELIFGGVNGINIIDPTEIKLDSIIPHLAFTRLDIFNEEVKVNKMIDGHYILKAPLNHTQEIKLPYNLNNVTISFAALSYVSPIKNKYRYKLEGEDQNWNFTTGADNSAHYSKLRPGKYKFIVYGSNSDGIWASDPLTLKIIITPPIWGTWWAYSLYIVAFLSLVYYLIMSYQSRLQEKNKLAIEKALRIEEDKSHNMKINFFTNIAHELKTPLTLIMGPIEDLISKSKIDKESLQKLVITKRSVNRMVHLINQTMDFAKIDSNIKKMHIQEYDLISFTNEIMASFNNRIERKGINYVFKTNQEQVRIFFDQEKMEKVIYNLISNAMKYSSYGKTIEIECVQEEDYVLLSVKDQGIGIREEDQPYIFNRYYQNNDSTHNGTGIGLALSKAYIELHHGEIWVESKYGIGSIFTIKIKRGREHFSDNKTIPEIVRNNSIINDFPDNDCNRTLKAKLTNNKEKSHVLVVEDNTELREYICQKLNPYFILCSAKNGEEALLLLKNQNIDIVVSDIMMPLMDGIELCKNIKSNIETSHIPVILLTAKNKLIDKMEGYDIGADDYVSKPFSVGLLMSRIYNLIKNREKLRELFRKTISLEPSNTNVTSIDEKFINKCFELVEKNMSDPEFNVDSFCSELGSSRPVVYRKLKSLTGHSITEFIRVLRLKRAGQLLKDDFGSVSEVMFEVGFTNQSYFSKAFKEEFGHNPKQHSGGSK